MKKVELNFLGGGNNVWSFRGMKELWGVLWFRV